ncbi:MAG: PilC/PilY family type IV pilus protein [Sulfuritalea sp.]|nr:PilC/PilY family type IV pilus protein [Sulfuritalea sp.]
MKSKFRKFLGAALFAGALLSPQLHADDIDLYTGGEAATGAQANVLIVLDNGTSWAANNQGWLPSGTKQGEAELQALSEIISTLGDNINVGLLMAANSNGGYVRFAIREMSGTNKTAFSGMLNTMNTNFGGDGDGDDKINVASVVYDSMMNAAYRYFNGFARFGTTDLPGVSVLDLRDYDGNLNSNGATPLGSLPSVCPSATCKQPAFPNALGGYSLSSSAATTYTPPSSTSGGCSKNFVIFIGNGYPTQAGTTTDLSNAAGLAGITDSATLTAITTAVPGGSARIADEWARFMYTYGVRSAVDDPRSTTSPKAKLINKIATYTIDVCKDACEANQATLLKSMAKVGGGKYFKSTSKQEIKNAMSLIFAEIQAVNSVFASATLPISVNTQGTYENQVYIGVFRPDGGSKPRWFGNLKEYKFGRYCDADRNDKVLIDNTRTLVNGMIPATLTGNATGPVTGSFTGSLTDVAGVATAVSGTVTGTVSGTDSAILAATLSTSAGTTASPSADAGSGTVTGAITGTGTGTGTSTFTGTLSATASLSGTFTATDERVGDDVSAPDCGTDASGKIPLSLYMGDKNGYRAIDEEGNTGFIDLSAKSFWSSASTFWSAAPNATAGSSDSPDGPEVERGAAAQRLRTGWAGTATSPHPDGRKVYTCLGTCLASAATATQKTLSNNAVSTSNTEVTAALAAPSGSATVTLARVGDTVTATSSAAHGFSDGASVTIAGATPTDYNGAKTITYVDATRFTYTLNESPTIADTATATKPGGTVGVSSITLSGTTAGTTVTATVTTATPHGLAASNSTTIANAAQAFLNGGQTVVLPAVVDLASTTFTFNVTIPGGNPASPATTAGSAVAVGQSATHTSVSYTSTVACVAGGTVGCVVVLASANLGNKFVTGNTVVVSGAVSTAYNTGAAGATIRATGTSCPNTTSLTITTTNKGSVYCYTLAAAANASSPDAGVGKTATTPGTSFPVNITRTLGSTTATAVTSPAAAHGFATTDTITITGATQTQYNGTRNPLTVGVPDANTFTFGPITLTPTTPPTGTITATAGSGVAGPDTSNLILWTRGKDLWEDEDINASLTNVRASIHGDVLHARPVVVNYGSSTGIVGFYGSNDGFLRAIHGGTSSVDGEEKWAFIPSEFMNYSKLARLYANSELVRYPNSACSIAPAPTARNYFWDGPLTAYQSPDGNATTAPSKTWLFATMRRGGRALYALDVTNPNTPKFMWRITNATAGFSELAQTWSEPKVTKLKGSFTRADATVIANPVVLIFGAGYDAAQEDKPTGSLVTPTMGRGVFVVEAETGQLIQFLDPTTISTTPKGHSFAADVNVLDLNADGYADRIYAGDTNANIFRFDTVQSVTNVASSSYWKRYHIAKVGDIDANGGGNARKFLFQPEILPFTHNGVVKTMVLVGSGNREKPLNNFKSDGSVNTLTCPALYSDTYFSTSSSNKIFDRFFGLLDAVQPGAVEASVNADPILLGDLQQINSDTVSTTTLTPFSLSSSDRGWHILLRNDPDGNGVRNEEKAVNAARVVAGTVFFATNTPMSPNTAAGVCSNLGEALGYAVDPFTGLPAINRDESTSGGTASYTSVDYATKFSGGGLPPTVTAGVVTIGRTPYRFIIGSGGSKLVSASSIAGARSVVTLTGTRTRLFWSYGAD